MSRKQKKDVLRAVLAVLSMVVALMVPHEGIKMGICLAAYALVGWDVVFKAVKGLFSGRFLDEHFLMSVASVGAFLLGEYPEAVFVMTFYRIGQVFEHYAVDSSRRAVQELLALCPDRATVLRDGQWLTVDPYEVAVGETLLVKPGERLALDAEVVEGETSFDLSSLTGESLPVTVTVGDAVLSGAVNKTHAVRMKTVRPFETSAASRIVELVESAADRKAKAEAFITRFARWYTPIVLALAVLIAGIPSLFFPGTWQIWVGRALLFLVVSCPCAVVISVPLSYFCGVGNASSYGVLVKGSDYLETAASVRTVLFDKTGTLTNGTFAVAGMEPYGVEKEELLFFAALAESCSSHPIALAISKAYGKDVLPDQVSFFENASGYGVCATVGGDRVLVGNKKWLNENGVLFDAAEVAGRLPVYVAKNGVYIGRIDVVDTVRAEAKDALLALRKVGVEKTVLLTGDKTDAAKRIAEEIGIDEVYAELLPEEKVRVAERFLGQKQTVMYVGDGINDAPVLSLADIGVAMGGIGTDAAIEAADVIVTDDNLTKLSKLILLAKKTKRISIQNIVFSIGIKILVMVLGAFGLVGMWAAVLADVGVCVLAILNAMRLLYKKKTGGRI